MIKSNQLSPGMTIRVGSKIYRIESCVKVSMARGVPFMKTKLKTLTGDEVTEKNFKLGQEVEVVKLVERHIEYLYLEGKDHIFLDIDTLESVPVDQDVIGDKVNFLKEGVELKAMFYGDTIFSVDLPQFLELTIVKTEDMSGKPSMSGTSKIAILETGAKVEVPMFIESGDVIKVDTVESEFVQRV
ncbi:MAG: elongation factor P [Simkaniaceae bacterium]|nr:elongation factor P [Simkaniaceae bacterium]